MKNTLFNTTDENNIKNSKNKISHSSFRTLFKSVFSDESPKKYIGIFSLILAVSLLAELFLFNYKWVVSSMNNPEYPEYTIANAVKQSDGKYKSNGDEMRLVIKDIDKPLSFLEFNIAVEDEESVPVTICAKDEANNNWLEAPSLNITNDVQRSHYPRLHFSGDVSELSVKFKVAEDKTFDIKSLALNPNVPLMFSLGRALFVWNGRKNTLAKRGIACFDRGDRRRFLAAVQNGSLVRQKNRRDRPVPNACRSIDARRGSYSRRNGSQNVKLRKSVRLDRKREPR